MLIVEIMDIPVSYTHLKEVFEYYDEISKYANIRVLRFEINEFNFSAINNYAVSMSDGKYVLFLNNDIEIINNDW